MGANLNPNINVIVGFDHFAERFKELFCVLIVRLVCCNQLIRQFSSFRGLHFFIVVIKKVDLQKPNQADQQQGKADEIDP